MKKEDFIIITLTVLTIIGMVITIRMGGLISRNTALIELQRDKIFELEHQNEIWEWEILRIKEKDQLPLSRSIEVLTRTNENVERILRDLFLPVVDCTEEQEVGILGPANK